MQKALQRYKQNAKHLILMVGPDLLNIVPLSQLLQMGPDEVLIESTGVIGQRIKKVNMVILPLFCVSFTCDVDREYMLHICFTAGL